MFTYPLRVVEDTSVFTLSVATVRYSAWAKIYYERMQAKGKGHHAILRALACKWIRVLWKCWQTRTPYDEARYLKQLVHRKSPNALPA